MAVVTPTGRAGRLRKSVKVAAARKHAHKADVRKVAGGKRQSLLDAAQDVLKDVLTFASPTPAVLGAYFREHREWGSRERALLGDVVYRVVRSLSTVKARARHGEGASAIAFERRLAMLTWPAAEIDRMGSVDEASMRWLDAALQLDVDGLPEDVRLNMPSWLITQLRQLVGDEFDALLASLDRAAPLDLRVNIAACSRDTVRQTLLDAGFASTPTPYSPWGLRVEGKPSIERAGVVSAGQAEIQDEGSQLLALLVQARRNEMVADFCAGGGGKTLALGAAMRNSGRLYALDTSASRLAAVAPRALRAGLTNVYTMALEGGAQDARLARLAGKLDRVLVDAPCSGLGTLRRSPELKWRHDAGDIAALAQAQSRILEAASRLVKPGGRLVYATCSVLPDENEHVVAAFLNQCSDFTLEDASAVLQSAQVERHGDLVHEGHVRLWPHKHGTDGFFAAILKRRT